MSYLTTELLTSLLQGGAAANEFLRSKKDIKSTKIFLNGAVYRIVSDRSAILHVYMGKRICG